MNHDEDETTEVGAASVVPVEHGPTDRPGLRIVPIARKHPSHTACSPEQLLEEFLADLRAGRIHPTNLLVYWLDDGGDPTSDQLEPRRWVANVSRVEEIAFHTLGIHKAIDDWRGK